MEVVTGALPSVIRKLADLAVGEYNLQKGLKGEIKFLQEELESIKGALEDISKVPKDQLPNGDKIWARNVRELTYDIEDSIDTFMVQRKDMKLGKQHGLKKVIDRSLDWLMQPKIRHKIAREIRDIKSRVFEVHERHRRYDISNLGVEKPVVTVDPRLFTQFAKVKELVGIDEPRDEIINMIQENEVTMKQGKIVSIVGFGGLGKTTLANVVYEKIRVQFDCCAFVSVSQTPDLKKLYKELLRNFGNNINEETLDERQLIHIIREFLQHKRYFVVVDDVWDISVWKKIRCALPDNDAGYNIITTTRISRVAEHIGGVYKLKPISPNNSRKLLYRRIFGNENKCDNEDIEKCPDEDLAEVSDRILKKCAGVPLAIITMASLLACKPRNKMEWYEVCNSVGTGLESNLDMENMRKILSFSYYELPCHLRTCLLYLSMFPEDFVIDKNRLIRMWIAEGFIQYEKPGKSLFELGESYFNELINRSMMEPIYVYDSIYSCRIHDMVLDLIHSLSREEIFVTVLNNMDDTSSSDMIRRLSLQNGKDSHATAQATMSFQQVRSVVVFQCGVAPVLALGSCRVLRVLDLEGCNLSQANNGLKYLGNLYHLRYLGLRHTHISELPNEIGNLQFLQTLDVWNDGISSLPSSVVQLRNLMFLYIHYRTRAPNGIGNLTCLEQLSYLRIDDSTINNIEELGQLTKLRVLYIQLDEWNDKLLEGLRKLQKIQKLGIMVNRHGERSNVGLDVWDTPRHLRVLNTRQSCWFSSLPVWMNPSLLQDLTSLRIAVREVNQIHVEILGRLPALISLDLEVDNKNLRILGGYLIGDGSFPCLVECVFRGFVWPMVFQQGAMPRLRKFSLDPLYMLGLGARESASSVGCLDLGLGNLTSLQDICIGLRYDCTRKEEAEEAESALTHAAETHPNDPTYEIYAAEDFSSGSDDR